jgi:hypothetical protein
VLLRGHGYCTVGGSIPKQCSRVLLTAECRLQQRAIALGGA